MPIVNMYDQERLYNNKNSLYFAIRLIIFVFQTQIQFLLLKWEWELQKQFEL